jgi:hypothetical protein
MKRFANLFLEKAGDAFFEHQHAILNAGRLGCLLQQLQGLVHGFVGEFEAFAITVTVDRIKSQLDPLVVRWVPKEHHDLLLLAFFALQVFFLTPLTTKWNVRLCWRSFDRTMGLVQSLLPEIDSMDKQTAGDEEKVQSLFVNGRKPGTDGTFPNFSTDGN